MIRKIIINLSIKIIICIAIIFTPTIFAATEGIRVYTNNGPLSPEKKQLLVEDIDRIHTADDLWGILRSGFTLLHYEENSAVQRKIQWYLNHQSYLQRTITRSAPYLYYILQQAKKRNLPTELVLLPIIESAYNPFALNSNSGAAGIWQMMPDTASGYGIRQNSWYDGRRDVLASTNAALNHLAYLESFFNGNWLLALAAYDTGEGNVLAAIRKNIRHGKSTDFWSLPLANETKEYVPQLLALANIIAYADDYKIKLPAIPNAAYLGQIDIGRQIDLKDAAQLAGLSLKKLLQFNPGYSQLATDPNGPHKLVLPIEHIQRFTENYSKLSYAKLARSIKDTYHAIQPGDTLYLVRKEDSLEKIAARFHISTKLLASINKLTNNQLPAVGAQIIIPTHNNPRSQQYGLSSSDTVYLVRHGDTIDTIARKFNTNPAAIRLINMLANNKIREGDELMIPSRV